MRRSAAILLALAGCTFDASGLGESPQSGAGPDTSSTQVVTGEPTSTSTSTSAPTTEETVGVASTESMSDSSAGPGGDPTTTPLTTTTTEPETTSTGPDLTTTTTMPGTTTEPCVMTLAYKDFDNDNFGDPNTSMMVCEGTQGWVPDNTDCNDMSANAHPGVPEMCDTIDNDCDGMFDEYDADSNPEMCLNCRFRVQDGSLYYFCSSGREWLQAEEFCVSHGLHLVKDDGGAEHDFLLQQIGDTGLWWIGANDRMKEGSFKWVSDGSDVTGDLWGNNEPNDQEWFGWENADCVLLLDSNGDGLYPGGAGRWNDHMCDDSFKFICEGPVP